MTRPIALTVVFWLVAACGGAPSPTASPAGIATTTPTGLPPLVTPAPAATLPSDSPAPPATTPPTGALTYDQLLTHIPPLVADCVQGVSDAGASVIAACTPAASLFGPDTETGLVRYLWFDHFRKADQYFGDQLRRLGDQFGEDCGVGPSHYLQEIDGEFIGRVLCAGDPDSGEPLEALWGDLRLNVVGWITIEPGSYPELGALLASSQVVP